MKINREFKFTSVLGIVQILLSLFILIANMLSYIYLKQISYFDISIAIIGIASGLYTYTAMQQKTRLKVWKRLTGRQ